VFFEKMNLPRMMPAIRATPPAMMEIMVGSIDFDVFYLVHDEECTYSSPICDPADM
jgi:hypothetical protein